MCGFTIINQFVYFLLNILEENHKNEHSAQKGISPSLEGHINDHINFH